MNKKIEAKLIGTIDQLLLMVGESARADMIPRLQADEIQNHLLDARHATTAKPAVEPEPVSA